jgi:hypothetical protein
VVCALPRGASPCRWTVELAGQPPKPGEPPVPVVVEGWITGRRYLPFSLRRTLPGWERRPLLTPEGWPVPVVRYAVAAGAEKWRERAARLREGESVVDGYTAAWVLDALAEHEALARALEEAAATFDARATGRLR